MTERRQWTEAEIQQIREGYLNGIALKIMAREMGRSPTALNKALTRFGIRPKKRKNKLRLLNLLENSISKVPSKPAPKKIREKSRHLDLYDQDHWVPFTDILIYLVDHGHSIFKLKDPHPKIKAQYEGSHNLYAVDGKIMSSQQMLVKANRLRVQENKSPFIIEDLIW